MTYRFEAVVLTKTGFPTLRIDQFLGSSNEQLLSLDLDLAEKRREVTAGKISAISTEN